MTLKLTRDGASDLTSVMDRVATVVQENPELLGIDSRIALDFAKRIDLISDAVETTAAINFPNAKAAYTPPVKSKLPDVKVQGYKGFTDQVRELEELSTESARLAAEIEAAIGPLLEKKKDMDKKIKRVHETIKKEYKENLTEIGNITIERKTQLVEAAAMLQVQSVRGRLDHVQAEMLQKVTDKYGAATASFITETTETLRDTNRKMRVSFKGFEMEMKTASAKDAGVADMVTRFQDVLMKGWSKMVDFIKNAAKHVRNAAKPVEKAHDEFISAIKAVEAGKTASSDGYAGFNLFV